MIINKILIWWFSFHVTTSSPFGLMFFWVFGFGFSGLGFGYFYLFIWSSGVLFSWSSGLGLPDQLDERRHHRDNLSCQLKLSRRVFRNMSKVLHWMIWLESLNDFSTRSGSIVIRYPCAASTPMLVEIYNTTTLLWMINFKPII